MLYSLPCAFVTFNKAYLLTFDSWSRWTMAWQAACCTASTCYISNW